MHSPFFRVNYHILPNIYEILIFSRIFRLDPNFLRSSGLCKVRGDCCGQSARMGLEERPARNLGRGRRGVDAA